MTIARAKNVLSQIFKEAAIMVRGLGNACLLGAPIFGSLALIGNDQDQSGLYRGLYVGGAIASAGIGTALHCIGRKAMKHTPS